MPRTPLRRHGPRVVAAALATLAALGGCRASDRSPTSGAVPSDSVESGAKPPVEAPVELTPLEEVAAPVVLTTDQVLAACVESGAWSGTLEDVVIDLDQNRVVGLLVLAGEPPSLRLLEPAALAWRPARSGFEVVVEVSEREDWRDLFDGREREVLEGRITAAEAYPEARAAVLKVHDDRNLHHRVLVELPELVEAELGPFEPGASVSVDAVPTRDAHGKLWIASSLRSADRSLRLRADDGTLLLADFVERTPTARRLVGTSLRTLDDVELPITGFAFVLETTALTFVLVTHAGSVHELPSEAVRWGEGQLVTELDSSSIAALPTRAVEVESVGP